MQILNIKEYEILINHFKPFTERILKGLEDFEIFNQREFVEAIFD